VIGFFEHLSLTVKSMKNKIEALVNGKKRSIHVDVFLSPKKYSVRLPINKIVIDPKVSHALDPA